MNEDIVKRVAVDPSKVKVGDLMTFVYYAKVQNVRFNGDALDVVSLDGDKDPFSVNGVALVRSAFSADLFHETVRVSMTEAAEILISSHNRPITVCFTKQEDGKERVLRGRLIKSEPLLGRSNMEDLDIVSGARFRLVDHRTLKYVIVDGMKYEVGRKPKKKKGEKEDEASS